MFKKAFDTTKEMYVSRGWKIIQEQTLPHSILAQIPNDDCSTNTPLLAIAKFIETSQEIKNPPLSLMIDYTSTEYGCVTIVCNGSITTNVKKIEQTTRGKVEIFHNKDLQMNITTYHLQPEFYKLSLEDAKNFRNMYVKCRTDNKGSTYANARKNFPAMSRYDPVARFFRFQTGDIIRITTQFDDVSYRIVK
jgi:RNA polymerase Rpb5, C-terminal domain